MLIHICLTHFMPPTGLFSYPLETLENLMFSEGRKKKPLAINPFSAGIYLSTIKTLKVKVNNKNTSATSLASFWCLYC